MVAVLHFDDLEQIATLALSARPEWLALAVLVQGVTYICAGSVWREALKKAGHQLPLASLATLGLVKLFADQALPTSGMSGNILLLRGLARRDIPTSITMAALLVDIISYYAAYLIAVVISVSVLLARPSSECRNPRGSHNLRSRRDGHSRAHCLAASSWPSVATEVDNAVSKGGFIAESLARSAVGFDSRPDSL